MKILRFEDDSIAFATPLSAYPGNTGVVDTQEEALRNNRYSPNVIEALGGNAAKTAVIQGPDGKQYIVKEGIDGDETARTSRNTIKNIEEDKSAVSDTLSAAYFVGNTDLHGGNTFHNEQSITVIDHDNGGYDFGGFGFNKTGVSSYDSFWSIHSMGATVAFPDKVQMRIYELAEEIQQGRDLDVPEGTLHYDYAQDAAEKAIRGAYISDEYDLDKENIPESVSTPPDEFNTISELPDPQSDDVDSYEVTAVPDDTGSIVEGEVINVNKVLNEVEVEVDIGLSMTTTHDIDNINHLTQIGVDVE